MKMATKVRGHFHCVSAEIEVRVVDCVRKNDPNLCQYVEADLIANFIETYSCLPWFNRQRETSCSGKRAYDEEVVKEFRQKIGKVQGSRYLWAIRPTDNNEQYSYYETG